MPFITLRKFLSIPRLLSVCHKLDFAKCFSCIFWDGRVVSVFYSIGIVYYTILYSWDNPHLVIAYNFYYVFLDWVCKYFTKDLWIHVHKICWSVVFFFCDIFVWFEYQGNTGLIEWVCKSSFFFYFLEEFVKN